MSRKETIQVSCPNCGHRYQKDVWTLINVDAEPYLKTALVTGLLNFTRCSKCGYECFLALPLVYHEAQTRRVWCYIPEEMGNPAERKTLQLSMIEELRRELDTTLRALDRNLTPNQIETALSYLESPRIFDDTGGMIEELQQVKYQDSNVNENDATLELLAALEELQNVDSDEKFIAILKTYSIFTSPETPAHLRGLSGIAQSHGDDEKAGYFNNLAEMLERATGNSPETEALMDALAAITEVDSEEELDSIFLGHPILSKLESVERLRHAATETGDENTARFYSNVADMLEERQVAEMPADLHEALQAFVEADSSEERIEIITSHPVLYSTEAISHFQQRAKIAAQSGEENVAEFWENLEEIMERILGIELEENIASPVSTVAEDINEK